LSPIFRFEFPAASDVAEKTVVEKSREIEGEEFFPFVGFATYFTSTPS
jgi:hypothetical protein